MKYDTKTNALISVVLLLVIFSAGLSFYKYLYTQDYFVYAKVPCNTFYENCFIEECDLDDPRCNKDGLLIYKIVEKKANAIPPVDTCSIDDLSCQVTYCTDDNIELFELDAYCSNTST